MNFSLPAATSTFSSRLLSIAIFSAIAGCATVDEPVTPVEAPVSRQKQVRAQKKLRLPVAKKVLKRKIAIGRFTNESRYGKSFLRDKDNDPLGKQASDMLANRLVSSGKFLVFERPDLSKIKREQAILKDSNLIGVDVLILGSVTEFGRSTTGKVGFLSSTKKQTARAKVEIRIVDARTGHAFFSASGSGEASTESGEVAGFGSRADYDATLNDRAIGAAVSDFLNSVIAKLEERPWRTDILKIQGDRIYVSGGKHQGLKAGDILSVMRAGEKVKSKQSGFEISLPATEVGSIRIISLFGDNETNEGAVGKILSGSFRDGQPEGLFISEREK
jgi:curli biogenesis system outer membrane secretion channel CsgG